MKILVTAGNTQTPVDRVRCITNIFSGRTGARIAVEAFDRGHDVTFFSSHPEVLGSIPAARPRAFPAWSVLPYRTFEELDALLAGAVPAGGFDAVVHAAAVSDYAVAGMFTKDAAGQLVDAAAGKVKGSHPELWLRLVPTPKLVDKIRGEWGFRGKLVMFKLEVGLKDTALLAAAEASRVHSGADLMVANTLEGMGEWAFVGATDYTRVRRAELPTELLTRIESLV